MSIEKFTKRLEIAGEAYEKARDLAWKDYLSTTTMARVHYLDELRAEDEPLEQINEDRITALEEVALILRAKIEPETLTSEALERAETLQKERWGSF